MKLYPKWLCHLPQANTLRAVDPFQENARFEAFPSQPGSAVAGVPIHRGIVIGLSGWPRPIRCGRPARKSRQHVSKPKRAASRPDASATSPGRFWTVGTHASRHWRGRVDRRYGQSMLCRDLAKSVQARGTAFLRNDLLRPRGDGEPDQRIAPRFVRRPHLRDNHERQPGTPAVLPP